MWQFAIQSLPEVRRGERSRIGVLRGLWQRARCQRDTGRYPFTSDWIDGSQYSNHARTAGCFTCNRGRAQDGDGAVCGHQGSMDLIEDIDPEDARAIAGLPGVAAA